MGTGGVGESLVEYHVAGLVAEMVSSVAWKLGKPDLRRTEMVTEGERFGKANEQREEEMEEIRMLDSIAETAIRSAMKAFAEFYPPTPVHGWRNCAAKAATLEYEKLQGLPL